MNLTTTIVILGLGVMWLIQYGLTFWQMRRYNKRLLDLKIQGTPWVGLNGSSWKGRCYAVVVVDKENRIVRVEQLSGWTVMAGLKLVPGLEGRPVSDITDDEVELPVSKKLLMAMRDSVKHMHAYAQRQAEKAAAAKAEKEAAAEESDGSNPRLDCASPPV